ncbi:MAG: PBP1A family penicillin-binding protein [Deltaproteobacteria bacterium]|nr:PBP1A family penicillin-binding protein [Deltaproteobacteria bacterium]MBW2020014.1 PBP1A family penicillin-binding protein [Deltaproteobacteria bacterium]MBW2074830.1 PBP1A family penicillin-binding protein [Deltaproteobacteria bacterium]
MTTSRRRVIYIVFLLIAVISGAMGGVFLALTHDLPQIRALETFKPAAITRIYSTDKELLAELFTQKRVPVPLHMIPDYLKQAVIATEDRQFYEHTGVDMKGILRAIVRDIRAGEFVEGASTITQQLAKTLFLTPRKSIIRKLKEAFLAFQIERRYTKEEILELYLNQVYFGSGAYGVEAAAQTFFAKPVSKLTLDECALIAGMPKSPSRYSPLVNKSLALKRRAVVLEQMARNGMITSQQLIAAKSSPLNLAKRRDISMKAPYFVAYVRNFLEKAFGGDRLYRTGLTVHTTLNYELQKAAEKAVTKGLEQLSTRMQRHGLLGLESPQAALASIDASRGAILAMVGGKDFQESPFNRATMARRQPGSAFKPLIYACALENGFAQNDVIWDAPIVFKGAKAGADWTPKNFSNKFRGDMTLRQALAVSQNIPAVKLLNKLGPSTAVQWAYRMGIESPLQPNLSLVLGTSEVTLLELTAAYAVFPNRGVWTRPFAILEVLDREGRSIWRAKPQMRTAISPETAAIMTDMLQAVVQEGTGKAARCINRPLAGKTGTTDSYRDALFVGFSPTIVTGVWVGLDHHGTLGNKETGARAALPIWIDFMEQALAGRPYRDFSLPEGVVRVRIDAESGLLASENCPNAVTAVFKKGTEPKHYCKHASGTSLTGL